MLQLSKIQKVQVEEYPNNVTKNPLLSVIVTTYNHEKHIKKCLDGILIQKTRFMFEVLLGEDASTDNTRKICKEYAKKYPKKIKLFLHRRENNIKINNIQTGRYNFLHSLMHSNAKYIALCEGDDYWTDPYKLQKQVDFLEAHPEYSLCFHNAKVIETNNETVHEYRLIGDNNKSKYKTEDLLTQWFIPTNSLAFRKNLLELPNWFFTVASGDIVLLLLLSTKGPFHYIDEIMSVYRKHENGLSRTDAHLGYQKVMNMCYLYQHFNVYTNYKYQEKILEAIKSEVNTHVLKKEKQKYKQEFEKLFSKQWENNLINNVDYLEDKISLSNALRLILKKILKKLR